MSKNPTAPQAEQKIGPAATKPSDLLRQKLHEDISENEQRYRDLVEHVPLCIAVICEGRLVFINQPGATMLAAQKPESIIGRRVLDFVHPEYKQLVASRMTKVLMGEQALPLEEKFVRLDGKIIHAEVSAYPFTYQGKAASQVIVRDITEEKEARLAAKKSETLFSSFFTFRLWQS
ncbi:MAG: PAS domain S-box protein [Cyclobacteriaceae bacterium]